MSITKDDYQQAINCACEISQEPGHTAPEAAVILWREVVYLRKEMKRLEKERDKYLELGRKYEYKARQLEEKAAK